ncbi:MAG: hypothetical protein AAGI30_11955 [Planctomycetota bacterium]
MSTQDDTDLESTTPPTTHDQRGHAVRASDERHAAHLLVQSEADLRRAAGPDPDPAARSLVLFMIEQLDEAARTLHVTRSSASALVARAGELRGSLRRIGRVAQDRVNRAA